MFHQTNKLSAEIILDISDLPIRPELKIELKTKLEENPDLAKLLDECSSYIKPFYSKNGCDQLSIELLTKDIISVYIFLKLKQKYLESGSQEKEFNSSLKICLGYLCALANLVYANKQIPTSYSRDNKKENIYARFFCGEFDKDIFKSKQQYDDFHYGFESCKNLLNLISSGDDNLNFSISKNIIYYFHSANPRALLEGREKLIADFINESVTVNNAPGKII